MAELAVAAIETGVALKAGAAAPESTKQLAVDPLVYAALIVAVTVWPSASTDADKIVKADTGGVIEIPTVA